MRHRITSFRCVEAEGKVIHPWAKHKTCNAVNIWQSSLLRAFQARQSSTTRAASAQAGTTSAACPETLNAVRPRLNAIASSSGSYALNVALSLPVAGLKLAGRLRVRPLVQTNRNGAAPVAGFEMVTDRAGRAQAIVICGRAAKLTNVASLPPGKAA
jgi:hypothetical protein